MPSAEGRGKAKAAWDTYVRAIDRLARPTVDTLLGPSIKSYSVGRVSDLIGFWMLWQLHGGFQGVRDLGMSRSAVFRKVAAFREMFGVHPDEFELPGVELDRQAYWAASKPNDTP